MACAARRNGAACGLQPDRAAPALAPRGPIAETIARMLFIARPYIARNTAYRTNAAGPRPADVGYTGLQALDKKVPPI